MNATRKITVAVPVGLLQRAQAASGKGLAATVCAGLRLVAAGKAVTRLRARRGKVRLARSVTTLRHDRG